MRRGSGVRSHWNAIGRSRLSKASRCRIGAAASARREWRRNVQGGNLSTLFQIEPVVVAPDAFLNRGLSSERRTAQPDEATRAKMGVVDLAVGRFHDLAVACPLQGGAGRVLGRDEMHVRMQRIGAFDGAARAIVTAWS